MVGPAPAEWPDGVIITGTSAVMRGLLDIGGLDISDHGQRRLEDDRWEVNGSATPAAAAAVRARGCTVMVFATGAELRQRSEAMARARGEPGPGPGPVA